jgi:hypothetical protein
MRLNPAAVLLGAIYTLSRLCKKADFSSKNDISLTIPFSFSYELFAGSPGWRGYLEPIPSYGFDSSTAPRADQ